MFSFRWLSYVIVALAPIAAHAQEAAEGGLRFYHHDWSVSCDNTRTCRADGYHPESNYDGPEVSVLFTRKAGPRTPIEGELALGGISEAANAPFKSSKKLTLTLRINGRASGSIEVKEESRGGTLPQPMTQALLAALSGNGTIEFVSGKHVWTLSGRGATAVLLKMDEFQGRIGTPSAVVRKGSRDEQTVLPPLEPPVVRKVRFAPAQPGDEKFIARHGAALLPVLRASLGKDGRCDKLSDTETPDPTKLELQATRLTGNTMVISAHCWLAAYNFGYGIWIVNDKPPFKPQFVNDEASSPPGNGEIVSGMKGRGIGDCFSSKAWTWNGKTFVLTDDTFTGACRYISGGGSWLLPTRVTKVIEANAPTK
jgi:hypothetical protein